MSADIVWRGPVTSHEVAALHAAAFDHPLGGGPWTWAERLERHSLGWVAARDGGGRLVGFANVISDGGPHAWLIDLMVAPDAQRTGLGQRVVAVARHGAEAAGCVWLHVDFEAHLRPFYLDACGFQPSEAGLLRLGDC